MITKVQLYSFNASNAKTVSKRQIKMKFASKRAEIIAWSVFFGVGVLYYFATLMVALVY
ncbi:MAG: hypothetical protein IPM74_14975 [Crocinitomicaceae bacterium]|nr:hypothetical protein [Crocinitomicaceae bacterium]MBK8927174.1 hypothetical protein [Crocinitomicaceae bacterium]